MLSYRKNAWVRELTRKVSLRMAQTRMPVAFPFISKLPEPADQHNHVHEERRGLAISDRQHLWSHRNSNGRSEVEDASDARHPTKVVTQVNDGGLHSLSNSNSEPAKTSEAASRRKSPQESAEVCVRGKGCNTRLRGLWWKMCASRPRGYKC